MSELSSGFPLPSRDAQELNPGPPWLSPSDPQSTAGSKASLALAVLSEKIKSGALRPEELMQRITAQAAAAASAKGVALALRREPEGLVVCCASTREMAPPVGTILDLDSGFTAECLRNGTVMICEDAEVDTRVDRAACRRLGVRSIVALPVENEGATVGVLEALSDEPAAFSKQQIEALLTLACLAKSAIAPVDFVAPIVAEPEPVPVAMVAGPSKLPSKAASLQESVSHRPSLRERIEESGKWSERIPRRVRLAVVAGAIAAVLLAVSATFLLFWMWGRASEVETANASAPDPQPRAAAKPAAAVRAAGTAFTVSPAIRHETHAGSRKPVVAKASAVEKIADEDTPTVHSSGEPRMPTSNAEDLVAPEPVADLSSQPATELASVLSVPNALPGKGLPVSEGVIPARLEHRVNPIYPSQAKLAGVEGTVVLRAAIDEKGKVKSVAVLKGSTVLASAASDAVRQWRYHPEELNHKPVPSTTDITIVFRLQ